MKRWVTFPVYPWFIGLVPLLHLYLWNFNTVDRDTVLPIFALQLLVISVVFGVLFAIYRRAEVAALVTSVEVLFFGNIGRVDEWLSNVPYWGVWFAVVVMMLLFLPRFIGAKTISDFTLPLNVVAVLLLMFNLGQVMLRILGSSQTVLVDVPTDIPTLEAKERLPNIYYIIMDGYPSEVFLEAEYEYDNSRFTDALRARGFIVPPAAQSNYPKTLVSLMTTLNMRFLNQKDLDATSPFNELAYAYQMTGRSRVALALEAAGYEYIYVFSGWMTVPTEFADINVDFAADGMVVFDEDSDLFQEFQQSFIIPYVKTSVLFPITNLLILAEQNQREGRLHPTSSERFRRTFDYLKTVPENPAATFTVAHMIKPHFPVTFDREGNDVGPFNHPYNDDQDAIERYEQQFFDQLEYLNREILTLVDHLQSTSDVPPIIIIQGDHGSYLGQGNSSSLASFDVLSAISIPEVDDVALPENFTNVNTFRVVFDTYFGTSLGQLEYQQFDLPGEYSDLFRSVPR